MTGENSKAEGYGEPESALFVIHVVMQFLDGLNSNNLNLIRSRKLVHPY